MPPDAETNGLRLLARDADDLAVVSACLQDALVPVADMAYLAEEQSFVFVANRFRWEAERRPAMGWERTLCAVAFDEVRRVFCRAFRRGQRERILELLAIRLDGEAGLRLDFAGGCAIRLQADRIRCRAKDVGLPWPTAWEPSHQMDERA